MRVLGTHRVHTMASANHLLLHAHILRCTHARCGARTQNCGDRVHRMHRARTTIPVRKPASQPCTEIKCTERMQGTTQARRRAAHTIPGDVQTAAKLCDESAPRSDLLPFRRGFVPSGQCQRACLVQRHGIAASLRDHGQRGGSCQHCEHQHDAELHASPALWHHLHTASAPKTRRSATRTNHATSAPKTRRSAAPQALHTPRAARPPAHRCWSLESKGHCMI